MNPQTPGQGPDSAAEAVVRANLERQRARQGGAGRVVVAIPIVLMGLLIAGTGVASGGWAMLVLIALGGAIALAAWPISRQHTRQVRLHADATAEILERTKQLRMRGDAGSWPTEPPAR